MTLKAPGVSPIGGFYYYSCFPESYRVLQGLTEPSKLNRMLSISFTTEQVRPMYLLSYAMKRKEKQIHWKYSDSPSTIGINYISYIRSSQLSFLKLPQIAM